MRNTIPCASCFYHLYGLQKHLFKHSFLAAVSSARVNRKKSLSSLLTIAAPDNFLAKMALACPQRTSATVAMTVQMAPMNPVSPVQVMTSDVFLVLI